VRTRPHTRARVVRARETTVPVPVPVKRHHRYRSHGSPDAGCWTVDGDAESETGRVKTKK